MASVDQTCKLLSIDGGGVRGMSALLILRKLMEEIRLANHLDEMPRPCEYFDLIGGSSTGGIIAIMLGRLGMTVGDCIKAYQDVARMAFTPKPAKWMRASSSSLFSATQLKAGIQQVVREYCTESDCIIRRSNGQPTVESCPHTGIKFRGPCVKTVVLAVTKDDVEATPTLFTTYDTDPEFQDATIEEIALATSAAATFFEPVPVGSERVQFVDAGFGHSNPCEILVGEVQHQFPNRPINILSIGAGLGGVVSLKDTRRSIIDAFVKMSNTTQQVSRRLRNKYKDSNAYFRFNVERGLDDIGLADWEQSSTIAAHTGNYLRDSKNEIARFVESFRTLDNRLSSVLVPELSGVFEAPETSIGSTSKLNVPFECNPYFTGREAVLNDLEQRLSHKSLRRVALVGLGGVGKTQVALQLAHLAINDGDKARLVLWLPALSLASFETRCREIVSNLDIACTEGQDPKELLRQALASQHTGSWLVIVDNADDMKVLYGKSGKERGIMDFLPPNKNGHILFTTRVKKIAVRVARTNVVRLSGMALKEARLLFQRSTISCGRPQDDHSVHKLLQKLDFHPLAITQAANYINVNEISVTKYLHILDAADQDKINLLKVRFEQEGQYRHEQAAVATTWIVSFEQIRQNDPNAARLLSFMAWIEPESIPLSMLPSVGGEERMTSAIGTLVGYGFVNRRGETDVVDLHSLVQFGIRVWIENQETVSSTQVEVIQHLIDVFPDVVWENRETWRSYLPHALRTCEYNNCVNDESLYWLGAIVGNCLRLDRRTLEAVKLLERLMATSGTIANDKVHGYVIPYPLGCAYRLNGQTPEAVRMLEQAAVYVRSRAGSDPMHAWVQHALGMAYRDNQQSEKAIESLEYAMEAAKDPSVGFHLDKFLVQHELASAYEMNGQLDRAIPLLEDEVAFRKKTMPETHPNRLAAQHELAGLYLSGPGPVEKAIQLLEHVVTIRNETLAEDHPDRLAAQHELARAYLINNRVDEALPQLEHVVAKSKERYKEHHIPRLRSQFLLSEAYLRNKQVERGIHLMEYVMGILQKTQAEDHPDRLFYEQQRAKWLQRISARK